MAQPVAAPPPLPANRGPYAARLALKLVEEALGPLCRTVLKCLLDHGMQRVRLVACIRDSRHTVSHRIESTASQVDTM